MSTTGKKLNILVSGATGVTSRSVVRALRLSETFKDSNFIGTDVCYNRYGIYEGLYKKVYKVPYTNEDSYRSLMEKIIKEEKIDAAIIIPEPEVLYWSKHPFEVKFFSPPAKFSELVISKKRLYEALSGTGLIPDYQIISKAELLSDESTVKLSFPLWVRDFSEGSTSGKGSYRPDNYNQLKAWLEINPQQNYFMLSEFLPGRNFGCFLFYENGKLRKAAITERLVYFMSKVSISGITGNVAEARMINDDTVIKRSDEAVRKVCQATGEKMHGLVVVDSKENSNGLPMVTEINIRPIATTSSVAKAGCNMAEYLLLCALGRSNEISSELQIKFPLNNIFFRDIDGTPVYVEDFHDLEIGDSI